jgi:hypothetical protein
MLCRMFSQFFVTVKMSCLKNIFVLCTKGWPSHDIYAGLGPCASVYDVHDVYDVFALFLSLVLLISFAVEKVCNGSLQGVHH